jgi:hypothetical protein
MSSRQLRKLQQQKELEQAKLQAEAEEDSEEEPDFLPQKAKPSLFASLAALEDEGEGDEDEDEQEAESAKEDLSEPEPSPAPAPKAKKSKKKKKAKNKAKAAPVDKQENEDEIEAALQELNLKKPSGDSQGQDTAPSFDPEYERVCALLGIQKQHLKVANEMRNLFGKTAIENHDDAGGPIGRGARRRQRGQNQMVDLGTALKGHHPPGKGLSALTLRHNCLIQGKDDWPKGTTGGLTMEVVDDMRLVDGTVEFRYVHDKTYQSLQQAFHGYVEMGDPQNLIGLLTRNRKSSNLSGCFVLTVSAYHISLLLQVSIIAKDQGDHAVASDLVERALFTFGRAASSLFSTKLAEGKARLDFHRPENRELWLAGYQYIKSLVMKGTYRTAFEWAKLLLSLDPEGDPYCMRLMIHHLALRAHQFKWLLDICDPQNETEGKEPLIKMNNSGAYRDHNAPSLALAAQQLGDGKKSREILTKAMQQVPWLFVRLFTELNLDAPSSIWGALPRSSPEELFTSLYVKQTKDLWNTPEATALLMEIAHTIPKVDTDAIPKLGNDEMTRDVVRFIYLDNTPALMSLVPSAILHRSNNSDSDPLPPDNNVISYESQRIALQEREAPWNDLDVFNNPLAALRQLIPILPRFRGEDGDADAEAPDEEGEEEEEEEEGTREAPSIARNFLNLLWRRTTGVEEHSDEHLEEYLEEHSHSDAQVPDLEGHSDDELPDSAGH